VLSRTIGSFSFHTRIDENGGENLINPFLFLIGESLLNNSFVSLSTRQVEENVIERDGVDRKLEAASGEFFGDPESFVFDREDSDIAVASGHHLALLQRGNRGGGLREVLDCSCSARFSAGFQCSEADQAAAIQYANLVGQLLSFF